MLEREIISSCYSEEMYNDCKFLEPKDFQNKNLRTLWEMLQLNNGDTVKVINSIKADTRQAIINEVQTCSMGAAHTRLSQMALCLVEKRFKRLFNTTLNDLFARSESNVEKSLIQECIKSVDSEDIFILSDHSLDYIGDHATTYTKQRLSAFLDYRNKRIEKIKQITELWD